MKSYCLPLFLLLITSSLTQSPKIDALKQKFKGVSIANFQQILAAQQSESVDESVPSQRSYKKINFNNEHEFRMKLNRRLK